MPRNCTVVLNNRTTQQYKDWKFTKALQSFLDDKYSEITSFTYDTGNFVGGNFDLKFYINQMLQLKTLELHCFLNTIDILGIVQNLQHPKKNACPDLTTVNLSHNKIDDFEPIARLLRENPSITSLNLSYNYDLGAQNFVASPQNVGKLCKKLAEETCVLKTLDLSGYRFSVEDHKQLSTVCSTKGIELSIDEPDHTIENRTAHGSLKTGTEIGMET